MSKNYTRIYLFGGTDEKLRRTYERVQRMWLQPLLD